MPNRVWRRGALVFVWLSAWSGAAVAAVPALCTDGRFVQSAHLLPGPAASDFDAVVIQDGQIAIDGACPATHVHLKKRRAGTRVKADWRDCGAVHKVRLRGTIIEDGAPCGRLFGNVLVRKAGARPLGAARTRCGDGILDPANAEACEPPGTDDCSDTCTNTATGAIDVPARQWTWVPFSNAYCADGSTTGLGVNPGTPGHRVVWFLNGGGACWDESTCYTLGTAAHISSGYGALQFSTESALNAGLFDRTDATNPFRDDTFVFVPYCTGDVHAGSNPTAMYGSHLTRHVGFQNMAAYLARVVPSFPNPSRVILSGSSAGGFGALSNWWQTQTAFGATRVDLIDDSGPPLPNVSTQLENIWRTAWNLAAAAPPGCTECANRLDAVVEFYGAQFSTHRAALLSYTQDNVISVFYQLPGSGVEAGLQSLVTELAPFNAWRHFFISGSAHTMLGNPAVTQNGVALKTFLTQMVTDDAGWANVAP